MGKTIPTKLKLLRGNPGKRKLNPSEPTPKTRLPTPPQHLDEVAREEWARIGAELLRFNLVSEMDRAELAAYCQCYSRWVAAEKGVAREGLTRETIKGGIIQNPLVGVANRSMELMHRFLTEFGMTPSSRSKLSAGKNESAASGVLNGEWSVSADGP